MNHATAYLAQGVSFFGSGNGSIPASIASANSANSSSMVSGSLGVASADMKITQGSAVGFQPET